LSNDDNNYRTTKNRFRSSAYAYNVIVDREIRKRVDHHTPIHTFDSFKIEKLLRNNERVVGISCTTEYKLDDGAYIYKRNWRKVKWEEKKFGGRSVLHSGERARYQDAKGKAEENQG